MYSWLLLWNFPGRETSIKVSVWGKSLFSEHTHIRPSSCNISDSYGHTYFSLLVPQPSSLNTIPMVTEQVNEAAPFPHHTHWSSGPRHRADREGGTCRSSASLNSFLVQEVVMPPRMGLNPWEKMRGSKRIDPRLPFPPPPPSSLHRTVSKVQQELTWPLCEAKQSIGFVIQEVVANSVAHPCVFVFPPSLASLLVFLHFYYPGIKLSSKMLGC